MKRNRHHWAIKTLVAIYYGVPVVACLSVALFVIMANGDFGVGFMFGFASFSSAVAGLATGITAWAIRVVIQNCIELSRGDDCKNAGLSARAIVGAVYIVIGLCVWYIGIAVR